MIIKWTFGCFRVPFRWNWNSVIVPRSERNPPWKVLRTTGWCLSADRSTATFSILWRRWYFIYTKVSRNQKEVCEAMYYYISLWVLLNSKAGMMCDPECTLATWCMQICSTVALQGQKVVDICKRDRWNIYIFLSIKVFVSFSLCREYLISLYLFSLWTRVNPCASP